MRKIQPYEIFEGKGPCWTGYKQIGTKMKNGRRVPKCVPIIKESKVETLQEFSKNRLGGATKIAQSAKEKGGDAMLTYHHFKVKLPYYKMGVEGKLDMEEISNEYKKLLESLYTSTKNDMKIEQVAFQELVGKIEVLGELLIKDK